MKIKTQLTIAIIAFGIAIVFIAGSVVITTERVNQLNTQQDLANKIENEANDLSYLSAEYVLYPNSQQAEEWKLKDSVLSSDLSMLAVETPEQQAIVDNLMADNERLNNVFNDVQSGVETAQQGDLSLNPAATRVAWNRLAVQVQEIVSDSDQLSQQLGIATDQATFYSNLSILILLGVFSLLILTSYLIVYRRTLSSIAELQNGANVIGSGNLNYTIPEKGDDEIRDLIGAFNQMTVNLRKVTASKTDLEQEIARRRKAEIDLLQKNEDLNAAYEEIILTQKKLHKNLEELTNAEAEIKKSEDSLRLALEAADLGTWDLDLTTDIAVRSLRHDQIWGFDELQPDWGLEIAMQHVVPEDRPIVREAYTRLEKTGILAHENRIIWPDGSIHWIAAQGKVYANSEGRAVRISGVVADITGRKDAEKALAHLSSFPERNPSPIIEIDAGGHIEYCNPGAARLFPDLEVNNHPFLSGLETVFDAPAGEIPELRVREVWAGDRCYQQTISYLPDIHRVRIYGMDITERRKAQEELIHKNADLNAAYEEISSTQEELHQNLEELSLREQELIKSETELKDALAEKEILLAEIHHRVKNNLTAFISLLSLDGSYEDTEAGRALRKDLQNRARSMALIHETLYRTGKFSNVDMEVYLNNLVSQIASSYADRSRVRLVIEVHEVTLDIARATTAGLIINELVTNSFKYAFPPGFDCMAERKEPCTIRVSLTHDDRSDILMIADNGCGLPEGFDPLTAKSLGLKLVNFLARHQLRAEIQVHAERGTKFIFRLTDTGD
jgi:PAS domain S-box-containing protein